MSDKIHTLVTERNSMSFDMFNLSRQQKNNLAGSRRALANYLTRIPWSSRIQDITVCDFNADCASEMDLIDENILRSPGLTGTMHVIDSWNITTKQRCYGTRPDIFKVLNIYFIAVESGDRDNPDPGIYVALRDTYYWSDSPRLPRGHITRPMINTNALEYYYGGYINMFFTYGAVYYRV